MADRWILGIDPGNEKSAYVLCDPDLKPVRFCKNTNPLMYDDMVDALDLVMKDRKNYVHVAIEMIENHGMPVGASTFWTCVWIGRLWERFDRVPVHFDVIYRSQEKSVICHHPRANDATIKQALIDRFAPNTPNYGKGSKKNPGWFHGFRADIWQAYAVAVTYHDLTTEEWDE